MFISKKSVRLDYRSLWVFVCLGVMELQERKREIQDILVFVRFVIRQMVVKFLRFFLFFFNRRLPICDFCCILGFVRFFLVCHFLHLGSIYPPWGTAFPIPAPVQCSHNFYSSLFQPQLKCTCTNGNHILLAGVFTRKRALNENPDTGTKKLQHV